MAEDPLIARWPCQRFLALETELARDLPDEPEVLVRVGKGIRRQLAFRAGLPMPLGRFLLVGPNSKALKLAAGLARFLFEDEKAVLWLDMEDYAEKHTISGLVGHPGGLVCAYFEGELTDPIWRRPQTVVVLDAIDRAHSEVWKVLGPVLSEGSLVDGLGRTVSFKDAIFILTTTVGYEEGAGRPDYVIQSDGTRCPEGRLDRCKAAVECVFAPEILRLFGDILLLR
jgi:ATP-dependent Clp protease ATP-binding subunit ClpB